MQTINTVIIHILLAISSIGGNSLWYPGNATLDPAAKNGSSEVLKPISSCIPVEYVKNYDGDTMTVHIMGISLFEERVRFIGVNTPEKGEGPRAKRATSFTRKSLEDNKIYLEFDTRLRDRYGRLLAYVWNQGSTRSLAMINLQLMKKDLAKLMIIPPDNKYETLLRNASSN